MTRYGHELARLSQAQQDAKAAFDAGKRGKISHAVLQDVQVSTSCRGTLYTNPGQSLLDTVQKGLKRAERDNDLIYHHDIPAVSHLPPLRPASLVSSTVPPGLSSPAAVLGREPPLFVNLLSWGAREAISKPFISLNLESSS